MTTRTLTNLDFAYPWADLRERLDRGIKHLNALSQRKRTDPADQIRLTWKREGVEAAINTWGHLNDKIAAGTMDHAGAWRTMTGILVDLFNTPSVNPAYYQGISLALTYQRGYGTDIDAPPVVNPHLTR